MSLHDELITEFVAWSPALADDLARDTPLLSSGRLDSLALFRLLLWVEKRIGQPIDVTAVDMATEWDTVDLIVAFVERKKPA